MFRKLGSTISNALDSINDSLDDVHNSLENINIDRDMTRFSRIESYVMTENARSIKKIQKILDGIPDEVARERLAKKLEKIEDLVREKFNNDK